VGNADDGSKVNVSENGVPSGGAIGTPGAGAATAVDLVVTVPFACQLTIVPAVAGWAANNIALK
jgi:hypothetical protein